MIDMYDELFLLPSDPPRKKAALLCSPLVLHNLQWIKDWIDCFILELESDKAFRDFMSYLPVALIVLYLARRSIKLAIKTVKVIQYCTKKRGKNG
jgi:hypothetical protein